MTCVLTVIAVNCVDDLCAQWLLWTVLMCVLTDCCQLWRFMCSLQWTVLMVCLLNDCCKLFWWSVCSMIVVSCSDDLCAQWLLWAVLMICVQWWWSVLMICVLNDLWAVLMICVLKVFAALVICVVTMIADDLYAHCDFWGLCWWSVCSVISEGCADDLCGHGDCCELCWWSVLMLIAVSCADDLCSWWVLWVVPMICAHADRGY